MNPNTKFIKLLRIIYESGDKKLSYKELSEKSGIEHKDIGQYYKRLSRHVFKRKINGLTYLWIMPHSKEYIKKLLDKTELESLVGERNKT